MEYELNEKDKLQGKPESEENFRLLSSFTQDAIIQINDHGLIVYWNKSAEKLFGLSETDVLNKNLHPLIAPERYLEAFNEGFTKFRNFGQGNAIGKTLELVAKKKNEEEFPIELSLSSFQVNGEWNAVGIIKDITKRRKAENKIKERLKELTCLYKLSKIAGEKFFNTDSFLKEAINIIPPAWQFPELSYAKITVEGKEYKTDNYEETKWSQSSEIYIENQKIGEIEVGYLEETPIFDEGPFLKEERKLINGISDILSGVLELKLTEEKLKQSETKHRNIINNLDAAFYQVLLGGRLLNHNPAYNLILGYDAIQDLKNTNVKLLWVNPDLRQLYLEQLLRDGYVKNYICRVLKKDGTKIVLQLNSHVIKDKEGKPVRIDGTFINVTEKFVLEQKLIESEEKYRIIFENANDAISILDLEGNFYKVNKLYCTRLGYTREEIMKFNVRDLEIPEYADLISGRLLDAKEKGFNVIETAHRAKDGRIIPVEISCKSILYDKKPAILTIARDITERKKSERLKEQFTEQLEKEVEFRTKDLEELLDKQRLYLDQIEKSSRFKTEFLATMSHELRTPLNAIIGFTDLLIEGVFGELNKEQNEYIRDIDDSSKHLLDMITHILDISKIESGQVKLKIEEIQLNNIIDQVISTLKPLYTEKDIKWELVGLKKERFIFADRIKFKQIIYNLLSNAIKFTKKGKIKFEFKENKKDWEFIVKDTGIGISELNYHIIFKDFKRVKSDYVNATQGTGLGLALTKRLINVQGGDIFFNSKVGEGTTFTFNLPKTLKEKSSNVNRVESFLNKL